MRTDDGAAWLVSRRFDLWMFLAPAVVGLSLVPLGPWLAPDGTTPVPMWVIGVLAVDVAHVWATLYRTYLDPRARARRRALLVWAPALAFAGGAALAHLSLALFWRVLAYLAVFHFIRQQYGWIALHHRKDRDLERIDRVLDIGAIYAGTIFPILWWHAHLPRAYAWFLPGDFVQGAVSPQLVDRLLWPYVLVLFGFALRQVWRRIQGRPPRPGKAIVVGTTAACWGVGIIATNTDWAFTVTNVLIHGVPYFGIVWVTARRSSPPPASALRWLVDRAWAFYALLLALAYLEELGWDRAVWADGHIFFGPRLELGPSGLAWATAFLSVPQVTHYLLDGLIWKRGRRRRRGTS